MDYLIKRREEIYPGGYIEIGPREWTGYYWEYDAIYIVEDSFSAMAEGIVCEHFPEFDPFGPNDIPIEKGHKIIKDWRSVGESFSSMSVQDIKERLFVPSGFYPILESEILQHRPEISFMLKRLARALDKFYQMDEWVHILGI